jgi:hypothetical protein
MMQGGLLDLFAWQLAVKAKLRERAQIQFSLIYSCFYIPPEDNTLTHEQAPNNACCCFLCNNVMSIGKSTQREEHHHQQHRQWEILENRREGKNPSSLE